MGSAGILPAPGGMLPGGSVVAKSVPQFQPNASVRNRFAAECREQRAKCSRSPCL
jgi:hypothetical protein